MRHWIMSCSLVSDEDPAAFPSIYLFDQILPACLPASLFLSQNCIATLLTEKHAKSPMEKVIGNFKNVFVFTFRGSPITLFGQK